MNEAEIEKFIQHQKWIFAKTYAKTAPHEYIVRDHLNKKNQQLFDSFAEFIGNNGYRKKYYSKYFTYLNIDDKKYWVMENIINRDNL